MRKLIISFAVIFLLLPAVAQAQSPITLSNLNIQLWPEYDQPAVLAIVNFNLSEGAALPAALTFKLPKDASVIAVAHDQSSSLVNTQYDLKVQDNFQLLTLSVEDSDVYRFEYYFPLIKEGASRRFEFVLPLSYNAEKFSVELQEPISATGIETTPKSGLPYIGQDGLNYQSVSSDGLKAGSVYTFAVKYNKNNDDLSATSLQVQPAGDLNQNPAAITLNAKAVGGVLLGLVLIGAAIWYLRNSPNDNARPRKKRHNRVQAEQPESEAIYCSQCGKRAQPTDKFCRACGTQIHKES
jgi:hypothetical protein